jgi:hypothetical protein
MFSNSELGGAALGTLLGSWVEMFLPRELRERLSPGAGASFPLGATRRSWGLMGPAIIELRVGLSTVRDFFRHDSRSPAMLLLVPASKKMNVIFAISIP